MFSVDDTLQDSYYAFPRKFQSQYKLSWTHTPPWVYWRTSAALQSWVRRWRLCGHRDFPNLSTSVAPTPTHSSGCGSTLVLGTRAGYLVATIVTAVQRCGLSPERPEPVRGARKGGDINQAHTRTDPYQWALYELPRSIIISLLSLNLRVRFCSVFSCKIDFSMLRYLGAIISSCYSDLQPRCCPRTTGKIIALRYPIALTLMCAT